MQQADHNMRQGGVFAQPGGQAQPQGM